MSDRLKEFLLTKQHEYELKIKKQKRKKKIITIIYVGTVIISITTATVVSTSVLGIPALVVSILGSIGAISSSLSVKFNLKGNNRKIEANIKILNSIKNKIDYVIARNGDLTEEKCAEIIEEFNK